MKRYIVSAITETALDVFNKKHKQEETIKNKCFYSNLKSYYQQHPIKKFGKYGLNPFRY